VSAPNAWRCCVNSDVILECVSCKTTLQLCCVFAAPVCDMIFNMSDDIAQQCWHASSTGSVSWPAGYKHLSNLSIQHAKEQRKRPTFILVYSCMRHLYVRYKDKRQGSMLPRHWAPDQVLSLL
jgi:2-C-methyl-D-erythritol 4-phosphate cytidylyltransferase